MNYSFEGRSKEAINLNACRFCLKTSRSKIQIDEKIKLKFRILMNEELVDNQKLQQTACKTCISELEQCVSVKNKIFESQKFLLELVGLDTKQEPENEDSYQQCSSKIETVEVKTELEEQDDEIADALFFDQSFQEEPKYKTNSDDGYRTPFPKLNKDDDEDFEIELNENGRAKCEFCKKFFEKKYLSRHKKRFHASLLKNIKKTISKKQQRINTKKQEVKCLDCEMVVTRGDLRNHKMNFHKKSDNHEFICDYCGASIFRIRKMVDHMWKVHRKNLPEGTCKFCNKSFASRTGLYSHVQNHHRDQKKIICDFCGFELSDQKTYEDHMRAKHTGEKPFKCKICQKSFHSSNSMHAHTRHTHVSGPQTCHICAKILVSDIALQQHIRTVHDEKKLVCGVKECDRKYGSQKQLNVHLFKHTGLKKYMCLECQALYKNRDGIQKHILSVHLNWSMKCQVPGCQHSFHRYDYFHTHIKRHHANLGQMEVRRLIQESRLVKIPKVLKHFKIVLNHSDAEKFKKFKENCELYKSEFPDFKAILKQSKHDDSD